MNENKKYNISAIVLTRGDRNLREMKESLTFCNETIVSENKDLKDFAQERTKLVKIAKNDWVFLVDDDEIVTNDLRDEIIDKVQLNERVSYAIPRRNFIFGKEMKHCGLWPDYVLRLFDKSSFEGYVGKLHEQPQIKGKVEYLKNPFIHNKHNDLSEMVDKTNKWSEVEARLMFDANHPKMNILRFFSAGFREFYLRMIKQAAFLDGPEGIIYGMYQVFSRLISYSKLWEIQIKKGSL